MESQRGIIPLIVVLVVGATLTGGVEKERVNSFVLN